MIGYNLLDKEPSSQYVIAEAFGGEYEINVSRVYGQPLGNRARLESIQNAGTPLQVRRFEDRCLPLDQNAPIKLKLKDGRRTELATVSPAAQMKHAPVQAEARSSVFNDLRAVANPNFYGAIASGPRGGAGTPGAISEMAARDSKNKAAPTTLVQNSINAGGVSMTTQLRLSPDQRSMDMVIRPFFQAVAGCDPQPLRHPRRQLTGPRHRQNERASRFS